MATVGNANVEITASSSQARSEVQGFFGFLQKTGSIATGVLGGLAIFETIKSTFSGLYDSTIGANASMEQYANTLTVVQGSAEKAFETLAWVKDFAAQTPFEIPELVEATTRLETYGITAKDTLGAIGDMASITGKPLMQAVEAVADAQTGELERLKEFGITKQMLIDQAAKMGNNELVNTKGQITDMKALNEALFAIMRDRYQGGMEIQSTSFNGLISNAKDSMGQLLTTLSQPIFENLKTGLKSVVPVMGAVTDFVKGNSLDAFNTLKTQFSEETAHQIMQFMGSIREGFNNLKNFIMDFQPTVENLIRIFKGLSPVLAVVGGALAVLWGVISAILPPLLNFITNIAAAIVEWEGFIPIVFGLVSAFAAFKTVMTISTGITTLIGVFKNLKYAMTAIQLAWLALNTAFMANPIAWIVALLVGLGVALYTLYQRNESFRNMVNQVWQSIQNAFGTVINWATTNIPIFWNMIVTGFGNMVNGVVTFFQNMGTRIMSYLQPFITYFVQSWENMKLLVLGIIQVFISLVTGNFSGLKLGLLAIVTAIKNQVVNFFNLMKNTVVASVVALWNLVTNAYSTGKSKVISFAVDMTKRVIDGFNQAKEQAINRVQGLFQGVVSWIGKIPQKFSEMKSNILSSVRSIDLFQIGKDIISGLVNGLGSMLTSVKNKAKEIADSVESAIRSKLKLKSPSRVLIDIGQDTGRGFIIGIDDMIRAAIRKAEELGASVTNAVSGEADIGLFTKLPSMVKGFASNASQMIPGLQEFQNLINLGNQSGEGQQHIHYWNINADEISEVSKLIAMIRNLTQSVNKGAY